jgi:hypothetical protein
MRPSPRPTETELRRGEAATWGELPRPRLRLISWRLIVKGGLRGFATVELPIGLKIIDVPVLVSAKGAWASLRAKARLDSDGRHKIGGSGKPAYAAVLEWRDCDLADGFSQAVVAAVRQAHPDDLAE